MFTSNGDIVCRLGGDEFLIICPGTTLKGALHIAEQTRAKIAGLRVKAGSGQWHGSISIGVAAIHTDIINVNQLLKTADQSVYLAKKHGKNCVKAIQKIQE